MLQSALVSSDRPRCAGRSCTLRPFSRSRWATPISMGAGRTAGEHAGTHRTRLREVALGQGKRGQGTSHVQDVIRQLCN